LSKKKPDFAQHDPQTQKGKPTSFSGREKKRVQTAARSKVKGQDFRLWHGVQLIPKNRE